MLTRDKRRNDDQSAAVAYVKRLATGWIFFPKSVTRDIKPFALSQRGMSLARVFVLFFEFEEVETPAYVTSARPHYRR